MIDGLALGETTPGPLIMVVAFVGYVGGWTKAVLGPDSLAAGGVLAACIATWFTFLPSFLFILAGGPLVERTHGALGFTAPLTAVTAAVVGVIVNLAVFFSWKVLWPMASDAAPFSGGFDTFSAVLSVAGIAALTRFKVGVIPLIVAFAAAGLAARLLV
jgi:chromate transporter